jgi:hypothetical protein
MNRFTLLEGLVVGKFGGFPIFVTALDNNYLGTFEAQKVGIPTFNAFTLMFLE